MHQNTTFINSNIKEPTFYIDFNSSNCDYIIGSPSFTESFDGTKAIHLENKFGKKAEQYIKISNCLPSGSFSISFWYKAMACGGCSHYPPPLRTDYCGMENFPVRAGGTIFANASAKEQAPIGFTAMNLPFDMSSKFTIGDGKTAFRSKKSYPLTVIQDMRWHNIIFCFLKGEKKAEIYIDAVLTSTLDFSEAEEFSNCPDLFFGADAELQYGIESGCFDYIEVYDYILPIDAIKETFSRQNLLKEIVFAQKILNDASVGERFSAKHIEGLKKTLDTAKANKDSKSPDTVYADLRASLNRFLMGKKPLQTVILASDSHLVTDDENDPACRNLINLLTANKKLGINAHSLVNAGDHCNTREPENHDHYFNIIDKYFRTKDTYEATCIGNHQYTHYALPGVDTFTPIDTTHFREKLSERIDLNLPPNKRLVNGNGILKKEYYYTFDGKIHYIMLNPWENCGWKLRANITEEQCDWLEDTLDYCNDGKPIFVVCHYPLDELSMKHNEKSGYNSRARINHLLKDYNNVFLIRGHSHNGLGKSGVKYREGYTEIDCPTLLGERGRDGFYDSAAYFLFMYKNSVVLRAFNCRTQNFIPEYDCVAELNKHLEKKKETVVPKTGVKGTKVTKGFNKATMTYFSFPAEGTNTGITAEIYDRILREHNEVFGDFFVSAVCYAPNKNYTFDLYDSLDYLELPAHRNKLVIGGIPFRSKTKNSANSFYCTSHLGNESLTAAVNEGKAVYGSEEYPICAIKADLKQTKNITGFLISNGSEKEKWNSRGYSLYVSDTESDIFEAYNKVVTFQSSDGLLNITEQYYYKEAPYGEIFTKDGNDEDAATFANIQYFSFTETLPKGRYVGILIFDGGTLEHPRSDISQFRIFQE